MNLFIIPSWYPSCLNAIKGIFIKEQAIAIGEYFSNWNVIISCWGQNAYQLPISQPHTWMKTGRAYLNNRKYSEHHLGHNVVEYHSPLLEWSTWFPFRNYFKNVLEVNRRHLRKAIATYGNVDLIHAHVISPAGEIAFHLSQEFNIPYLITEHMGTFPYQCLTGKDGKIKESVQEVCNRAQFVLGVSPSHAKQIKAEGIKADFVPNVVDENRFKLNIRQQEGRQQKETLFFSLSSILAPEKGIDDLLHAIAISTPHLPSSKFRIGGNGDLAYYRNMIKKLGIADRVLLLGNITREQAIREFNECDIFVLPSHRESFGMVFVEALFCGKPVIATRCGGGEYIIEEDQGILVDPKNRKQLAKALIKISCQLEQYSPQMIREKAVNRFSKEVVLTRLNQIFQCCLEGRERCRVK